MICLTKRMGILRRIISWRDEKRPGAGVGVEMLAAGRLAALERRMREKRPLLTTRLREHLEPAR